MKRRKLKKTASISFNLLTKFAFTMIELLVVVAIIAMLSVAVFASMRTQKQKAQDSKQISDINRLKTAFEDYYNDHGCYPPATWFDSTNDCGGSMLSPYLNSIPCQTDGTPYRLTTDTTGCNAFQLGATMQRPSATTGCYQDMTFCSASANFTATTAIATPLPISIGTASPTATPTPTPTATPTPTPTPTATPISNPTPTPIYSYCSGINNCTTNSDPNIVCSPQFLNDPYCGRTGCPVISTCSGVPAGSGQNIITDPNPPAIY